MAYSRWTRSRFYTYWTTSRIDVDDKGLQEFMVDDGEPVTVTYEELAKEGGVEAFLSSYAENRDLTPVERHELRGYVEAFMSDVRNWEGPRR